MHPEVVQDHSGSCPICGMALEPASPAAATPKARATANFAPCRADLLLACVLGLPVLLLAMLPMAGVHWVPDAVNPWLQLALCTPVVWGAGWPFLSARLAIDRFPQPQHVHVDLAGHGRRVWPKPAGDARRVPDGGHGWPTNRSISKQPRASRFWCCWARCWSCGPAVEPPTPFAPCWLSPPPRPTSSPPARRTICLSNWFRSTTFSASGPARRSPSMAW